VESPLCAAGCRRMHLVHRFAKGFTVGQMFFAGNNGLLNRTYDSPNLEQIRKVEEMIAYANGKGITVWIHPWWSRERLNERVGEEQMRRWWRYVIARLGAYNVIWVLAGEYNMNRGCVTVPHRGIRRRHLAPSKAGISADLSRAAGRLQTGSWSPCPLNC